MAKLRPARSAEPGFAGSVNLSTRDLLTPDLSHKLADLDRHGVKASSFCLEITESAIMDDPVRAEAMVQPVVRSRGFKPSIDDLARAIRRWRTSSGCRSTSRGDRQVVCGWAWSREDDAMIVRSTIDLAHNLA